MSHKVRVKRFRENSARMSHTQPPQKYCIRQPSGFSFAFPTSNVYVRKIKRVLRTLLGRFGLWLGFSAALYSAIYHQSEEKTDSAPLSYNPAAHPPGIPFQV